MLFLTDCQVSRIYYISVMLVIYCYYYYYYYYYYYFYKIDSSRMFSLVFVVLGSRLQQVTTGPRSLFSFFSQGQYFP